MIKLEAPYPNINTISYLPNPQFGDSEAENIEVQKHVMISGKKYTYVKTSNDRRKLLFSLYLTRMKALELKAFIKSYFASSIKLTDHLSQVWIGHFTLNPFDFEVVGPSEYCNIQLEFEGVLVV